MSLETRVSNIIKSTKKWVTHTGDKYDNLIKIEILVNKELVYRVILELENCMAQVIVEEPQCAPYKNVALEVVGMEDGRVNDIYSWYDKGDENISEILFQLDKGIKFAFNYGHKHN